MLQCAPGTKYHPIIIRDDDSNIDSKFGGALPPHITHDLKDKIVCVYHQVLKVIQSVPKAILLYLALKVKVKHFPRHRISIITQH